MKRSSFIILALHLIFGVGVAAADPGPNNPYQGMVTNVDCDGADHDYDLLYTVGRAPWFDPDGTVVGLPSFVERQNEDGGWDIMGQIPGLGVPTIYCTWERGDTSFRGDVQFAPAQ